MKKNDAVLQLEKMIGSKMTENGANKVDDLSSSQKDLLEWCSGCDEGEILIRDFDINQCTIEFYSAVIDGDDVSAHIVVCNEDVVSYGYTLD